MSRPFGVALLVAGVDAAEGPCLWNTEPSGTYTKYHACAIGSAQEGATSLLNEQYNKDMSLADAEILSLTVLRQVMEDKLNSDTVELAVVSTATKQFVQKSKQEIEDIIRRLP